MPEGVPTADRPEHPDGTQYPFNCCPAPDVRERIANGLGDVEAVCETCGHDWTDALWGGADER